MSIEFLLTSIVVILLPGTGVLYTLAVGLGRGFRPSVAAAFGCTLGILPAAIASIVGLAAILHTSALAFQIVKYLGVAYLFYMAWSIMKDGGTLDVAADSDRVSARRTIVNGMLLNVLNPKLSLFFMAFLPQFVPLDAQGATATLMLLAGVFMALTFVVFGRLRRLCRHGPRLCDIAPGCDEMAEADVRRHVRVSRPAPGAVRPVVFHESAAL